MKTFATLLSICAVAAGSYALLPPRADSAVCTGAKAISTSTIVVNGKNVELTTFSCGASIHADDDPIPTSLVSVPTSIASAAPAIPTLNVCSDVCGSSGDLPPTTDDCATIMDAITILNGSISPSFEVDSGHVQTLAFGTCRFFFENFSPFPMSNCWLSFGQIASAAASACLPPVQPVNSEGLCVAPDASWRVGVAHS
ncbi:hypothetical protein OH77DRAFT_1525363 [Trametes cingulata]|nr:hypothetical protein OH77DRAFT_1525363 [Trametes cingulata]